MSGVRIIFVLGVLGAAVTCWMIAGSPNVANAQQADSQGGWQSSPPSELQQPAAKVSPTDFSGCWEGNVDDSSGNTGTGFIDFVQHKKHLTHASTAGLDIANVGSGSAPVTGNVKGSTFKLQHFGHHCKVAFKGGLGSSNDVVGSYGTSKRCFSDGVKHTGSFDFTFQGATCP